MKKSYIASISVIAFMVIAFAGMAWFSKWLETKEEAEDQALYNTPVMTVEEFHLLENGMTHEEVANIAGSKGELIDHSGERAMYIFEGEFAGSFVTIVFVNGKLYEKIQVGLE